MHRLVPRPLLLALALTAAAGLAAPRAAAQSGPVCCALPPVDDEHAAAERYRHALAGADWQAIAGLTHPRDLAAIRALVGAYGQDETDEQGRPLADYSDAEFYALLLSGLGGALTDPGFVAAHTVRLVALAPARRDTAFAVFEQRWTYTKDAADLGVPLPTSIHVVKPIHRDGARWYVGVTEQELDAFRSLAAYLAPPDDTAPDDTAPDDTAPDDTAPDGETLDGLGDGERTSDAHLRPGARRMARSPLRTFLRPR